MTYPIEKGIPLPPKPPGGPSPRFPIRSPFIAEQPMGDPQEHSPVTGCYPFHPLPAGGHDEIPEADSYAEREADRIVAHAWRRAARRERFHKIGVIVVGLYGVALYLLGGLCIALAVVPSQPCVGVAALVALSVAFLAAGRSWRAWWRRNFYVPPTPYEQMRARVLRGMTL